MRTYKRKTNWKPCSPEMLERARQSIQDGISKRRTAADLGISETALRKRLKLGYARHNLGRFKKVFTSQQSGELADHCRALDKTFYGLTLQDLRSLAFQFAEANNIQHNFDAESKLAGRDWSVNFMS
nr:uncharacterized protein LOC115268160 [Aedes albopictus]